MTVLSSDPLMQTFTFTIHNVFVIYDESKAVPEIPSHNKVPQNHAAD